MLLFCYWAGTTVLVSYMVTYLKEAGYKGGASGVIVSMVAGGSLILQPLTGYLSDSVIPPRKLLIICFAAAIPLGLLMPFLSGGIILSAVITALCLLCEPQATLLDNYILRIKEIATDTDYGKIRSWGPAGSAVSSLFVGLLASYIGLRPKFYIVAFFLAACVFILLKCDEMPCPNKKKKTASARGRNKTDTENKEAMGPLEAVKSLAKIPGYLLFIVCCGLFQFAMRTATSFLGLVVSGQGGGSAELGILLFVVYAGQTPFMQWAGQRLSSGATCGSLFILASALGALRLYLFSLTLPFWIMAVTQLLQAAQTGIYTRVFVQQITDITPKPIHTTATSIGAAVSLGMGQIVGGIVHGRIIEASGASASAMLSAAVMLGNIALFVFLMKKINQKNEKKCA